MTMIKLPSLVVVQDWSVLLKKTATKTVQLQQQFKENGGSHVLDWEN